MNWTIYGIECAVSVALFTGAIMIPLCRNPVWWIHDYPADIQEKYFESRKRNLKFNMLMDYCIGKAATPVKEFYLLPVGEKLMRFDTIAVNTIVKNRTGEVSSCDILFTDDLEAFNRKYLAYTGQVAETCVDRDLSFDSMVIGTSAIIDTEIDGAVGMNSGIFNNPFMIWGKYRKRVFRYSLPVSFQFHHTQMDGAHAGRFLDNLQKEINDLRKRQ